MMYSSRKLNNKKVITTACNFWRQMACSFQVYGRTNHFCAKSTRKILFWISRFFFTWPTLTSQAVFSRQFFRPFYEDKGQKTGIFQLSWNFIVFYLVHINWNKIKKVEILVHLTFKVFRYSFSETIPMFFNHLKDDFILVRTLTMTKVNKIFEIDKIWILRDLGLLLKIRHQKLTVWCSANNLSEK